MNALASSPEPTLDLDHDGLRRACEAIAPTWPLDRAIAVNPFWEQVERSPRQVAATLAARSGATLLMPRAYFREQWARGVIGRAHLARALGEAGWGGREDAVLAALEQPEPKVPRRLRLLDVASEGGPAAPRDWRTLVLTQVSQFLASYFDDGQAALRGVPEGGLYATWRRDVQHDALATSAPGGAIAAALRALPVDAEATLALALGELDVPRAEQEAYASSLLLDLNGWAAWCAWLRWSARLAGGDDGSVRELLAIHLAWEWVTLQAGGRPLAARWQRAKRDWPRSDAEAEQARAEDWVFQRALELAWQSRVVSGLVAAPAAEESPRPEAQAVFCIDVRSEVYRRALEAEWPGLETRGFAGFFGLPIAYQPTGTTAERPQLPGLLAPRLRVVDEGADEALGRRRGARLEADAGAQHFSHQALTAFGFVETRGAGYALELLRESLGRGGREDGDAAGLSAAERSRLRPRVSATLGGAALTVAERADLAAGIVKAMGLGSRQAQLVALLGHGSQSRNNPHAAALDCGACCGQTGELNARAAAALLNDTEVRWALRERGVELADDVRFVAGLHDTTTDEVHLFETEAVPASHAAHLQRLRQALRGASHRARLERAPRLGVGERDERKLASAFERRARDWAQVRPEWGLAGNAAFVVGPRRLTRHFSLEGRSFLHDYDASADEGSRVLELILTAPMVVTHWINLQYYASTVDNLRYGSGNKVLHNVVGGRVGVFEGNGGDLRIGLSRQSLHDGTRWMHEPLRLSVFVAAPAAAMDEILSRHDRVRALVENEWLFLFEVDEARRTVRRRTMAGWVEFEPVEAGAAAAHAG